MAYWANYSICVIKRNLAIRFSTVKIHQEDTCGVVAMRSYLKYIYSSHFVLLPNLITFLYKTFTVFRPLFLTEKITFLLKAGNMIWNIDNGPQLLSFHSFWWVSWRKSITEKSPALRLKLFITWRKLSRSSAHLVSVWLVFCSLFAVFTHSQTNKEWLPCKHCNNCCYNAVSWGSERENLVYLS